MARSRRSRQKQGSSRRGVWYVLGGALVAIVLAAVGVSILAKRYLRSDAFRQFLAQRVSALLQVEGEFAPFSWTDASVYSERFDGRGQESVQQVDAQGIRAMIDFGSFRREAWEVEEVTINRVHLSLVPGSARSVPSPTPSPKSRSFLSRWLPQKVDVQGIEIADFDYEIRGETFAALGENLSLSLKPVTGDEGWQLRTRGGSLRIGEGEPMRLEQMHARVRPGEFFVTDAGMEILGHAALTTAGELNMNQGSLSFRSRIDQLRGDRVWQSDWRQRLLGTIHADIHTTGRLGKQPELKHRGTVGLKNGVLLALPVLEKLANYTRTERFRRLVLDEAQSSFRLEGDRLYLDDLKLRSDGLLQVEGALEVEQPFAKQAARPLRGRLEIGVVRDVLKWLPGAEKRVFTEDRSGFVWTTMTLGGTLEAPTEDLSPRLGKAVVEETVEAVPETAIGVSRDVLGVASGLLGPEAGGAVDEAGSKLIDQADGLIQEGLRLVPMLDLGQPR